MMQGIEILASKEVVVEVTYNWWLSGFIYLGFIIVMGIISYCISPNKKITGAIMGSAIGALFGILIWAVVTAATEIPVAYETQYKTTISDNVSMIEFIEKYEILEQDGKIYTIKERNSAND